MGPARLTAILRRWPPPAAGEKVRAGVAHHDPDVAAAIRTHVGECGRLWARAAAGSDPARGWAAIEAAGIGVVSVSSPAYPVALVDDPEPPAVLFHRGDPDVLAGPRVAIVGTRRCTRYGRDIAFEMGRDLAAVGVGVVSGLALGIDGAAHAGALEAAAAPPIAVVGSGLDVTYPRGNQALWRQVEQHGVVLSEAPLGCAPEPWRFPARNRMIAALADVVVVVESHVRGGSMHTVGEATRRARPVLAVPGPVRSPASAGTNRLLAEGATPACETDDVLIALGMSPGATRSAEERRPAPDPAHVAVLDALGWQPASLDQLAGRTTLGLGPLALVLEQLDAGGWVTVRDGWYERVVRHDG
jgi:DNA processing protein